MKNIRKIVGVLAVAVFVIGGVSILVFGKGSDGANSKTNQYGQEIQPITNVSTTEQQTQTSITPTPISNNPISYTMTEVRLHNSSKSCWSVVNGGVYDLTTWIGGHPGGKEAILSICGKDGSDGFNEQHDGQSSPLKALLKFKIGILK